ncbi:MAG: aminotransferase class V-fold PLP-dependent enzyme [Defluviitaleaceae bacterium]|nr:aminotransferase class V-fold PLP-dependent enzyme [Defluviitaleaceae bacterium]
MSQKIYFDNAATTAPIEPDRERIFGNPSSPHALGLGAERALSLARAEMASLFGGLVQEQALAQARGLGKIIFTSGGTESNNLALIGYALANKRKPPRIFANAWEHPSVTAPIKFCEEQGFFVRAADMESADIVSLSHVSHETGDINDIAETAAYLKAKNRAVIVHVDGVQGFCKEKMDMRDVDMYSFSGHKIHGASVGGLFVREGLRLVPILYGGGQEAGLRHGTENVNGILQTVNAAKFLYQSREKFHAHVAQIRNELAQLANGADCVINSRGDASPYILNMSFLGINGETLVHLLSEKGVYASMGAACKSRKKQKSMLELMGMDAERARSAVRFSFSHMNTLEEARAAREIIIYAVGQIKAITGKSI